MGVRTFLPFTSLARSEPAIIRLTRSCHYTAPVVGLQLPDSFGVRGFLIRCAPENADRVWEVTELHFGWKQRSRS